MKKPLLVCLASAALAGSAFAGTAAAQSHGGGHHFSGATHLAAGHGYYGGGYRGWHGYYGPRFRTSVGFYFGLPFFYPAYYPYYGPSYAYPVYTDYPAPVFYENGGVERVYRGAPEQAYRWYCPDPAGYFPQVRTCNKRFMKVSPDDGSGPAPGPGGDSMNGSDEGMDDSSQVTTS